MTVAAVTWLFVPGDRPDRFDKARASGADEVICDLEDGVNASDKVQGRSAVRGWLTGGGAAWVRINAPGTTWCPDDVAALAGLPGLRGVVVPKAESVDVLAGLAERLGAACPLVALVETARGVRDSAALAGSPTVARLAFGSIDFAADIGAVEGDRSLLFARSTLVLASRAAGKPPPVDGVTTELVDMEPVQTAAALARELGFGGKLCVHPRQVAAVAAGFAPTLREVSWAQDVLESVGSSGASAVAGQMVDKPVLDRARRILAGRLPGESL